MKKETKRFVLQHSQAKYFYIPLKVHAFKETTRSWIRDIHA